VSQTDEIRFQYNGSSTLVAANPQGLKLAEVPDNSRDYTKGGNYSELELTTTNALSPKKIIRLLEDNLDWAGGGHVNDAGETFYARKIYPDGETAIKGQLDVNQDLPFSIRTLFAEADKIMQNQVGAD
jgi:hypothetical protein